jgi:hypothetical protein
MARTVAQVLTAARGLLQDERTPYRYADSALATYLSEAVGEARRLRPDLFLRTFRAPVPFYTAADSAVQVPLPDMYFSQVVNYVVGRAELRDDQATNDSRAMELLRAFGIALTGGKR